MGDSYYKKAKGELPEKEASKSYARLLKNKNIYKQDYLRYWLCNPFFKKF